MRRFFDPDCLRLAFGVSMLGCSGVDTIVHGRDAPLSSDARSDRVLPLSPDATTAGIVVDSAAGIVYVAERPGAGISNAPGRIGVYTLDLDPLAPIQLDFVPFRLFLDARSGTRRLLVSGTPIGDTAFLGVRVLALPSGEELCELSPGAFATVNPSTEKFYVATDGTDVVVHNGSDCSLSVTLTVGDFPASIAVDPTSNRIYAAIHHGEALAVIDGSTDEVTDTLPLLNEDPTDIVFDQVHHRLYVAYSLGPRVTLVDTGATGTGPYLQTSLDVGPQPRFVTLDPVLDRAYFSMIETGALGIVGAASTVEVNALGYLPNYAAVDSASHCIFTTGYATSALYRICSVGNPSVAP